MSSHQDIAIVTQPGGKAVTETHTEQLADILSEHGAVTVVTANCGPEYLNGEYDVVQYSQEPTGSALTRQAGRFWLNQLRLCRVLQRLECETVVFFGTQMYALPVAAARATARDVVVLPRGDVPGSIYRNWMTRDAIPPQVGKVLAGALRGLEQASYRLADRVACYSPGVARDLGIDPGSDRVSTRAARYVDTERFAPARSDGGASQQARVGYVGRLSPEKNLALLADTIQALPAGVEAVVVGDGPRREEFEHRLGGALETDRVQVTGWLDHHEVADELAAMDVLLHLSHTESVPTSVLEALAAGTPVVASNVGGLADVVRDGTTGHLVAPDDDATTVTRYVDAILDDHEAYAERARQLVVEEYSFSAAVDRWHAIINHTEP